MGAYIGLGGAKRNATSALCVDGDVLAVCEQERLTRVRRAVPQNGAVPAEAIECVRRYAGKHQSDALAYAVAEDGIWVRDAAVTRFDHHFGHAATAFWSSPFDDALILVCDRHAGKSVSVWQGKGTCLVQLDFPWTGPGFADVYSLATEAFGFAAAADEYKLEALARLGGGACTEAIKPFVSYAGDGLVVGDTFQSSVAQQVGGNGHLAPLMRRAELADGIQRHIGALLVDMLRDVKQRFGGNNLCISGGLFYNSYFTTLVAQSELYDTVFVPVNPGNAGVAVGAAIAASGKRPRHAPVSPFLGPEYDPTEIKAVLDNCKLSYDYLNDEELIIETSRALLRGQLVGWFQGRMEWGPRALGDRSILASPLSPYTLENLNVFLKQREPHHSYSVSVCEEDSQRYFVGPKKSDFMEFEYEVVNPDPFRALMPLKTTRLRVQTVGDRPAMFRRLLKAFGTAAGLPVLVNTSFNGFHEPIVCTPRDAVRVFYGTGLDVAIIGNFVLRK